MGYANGLGNLQQVFGTADTAATAKMAATAKEQPNAASATAQSFANSGISGDSASLSPASGLLAQALFGSDVRTGKVAALQQSIAAGTYNVSAPNVAGKLMDVLLT
jgi:negative regulator of flagellin synthesis FlgM